MNKPVKEGAASSSSSSPSSAAPLFSPTPLSQLEQLLAETQQQPAKSSSRTPAARPTATINEHTPKVDLLLRPQEAVSSGADIQLPSRQEVAAASSTSSSASTAASSSALSRVCATCQRQYAKYVCPKCNLNTCSLPCYKSHNASCTHTFTSSTLAEERALEVALRAGLGRTRAVLGEEYKAAQQAKKQTRDIMQRVAEFQEKGQDRVDSILHDQPLPDAEMEEGEEEQEAQTEERLLAALSLLDRLEQSDPQSPSSLSNVDLAQLQSLLPPEVLKDFQRSIIDGRMSAWITRWTPWWRPKELEVEREEEEGKGREEEGGKKKKKMQPEPELTPHTWSLPSLLLMVDEDEELPPSAPALPSSLPPFSSLFPSTPSPLLPVHLIDLLYAYVYALLLYNGDPAVEVEGSMAVMTELSTVLTGRARQQGEHIAKAAATAEEATTAAASTSAVAAPASSSSAPSFAPTAALLPSLDSTLSSLLSTATITPSLSTSCCWALSRIGDVCQLLQSKGRVLRALADMQRIVDEANKHRKRAQKHASPSSAASSSSLPSSLSLSALRRKLTFFQSFVSGVLSEADLRQWNQLLYARWEQRWQQHEETHQKKKTAQNSAAEGAVNKQKGPLIQISQE